MPSEYDMGPSLLRGFLRAVTVIVVGTVIGAGATIGLAPQVMNDRPRSPSPPTVETAAAPSPSWSTHTTGLAAMERRAGKEEIPARDALASAVAPDATGALPGAGAFLVPLPIPRPDADLPEEPGSARTAAIDPAATVAPAVVDAKDKQAERRKATQQKRTRRAKKARSTMIRRWTDSAHVAPASGYEQARQRRRVIRRPPSGLRRLFD